MKLMIIGGKIVVVLFTEGNEYQCEEYKAFHRPKGAWIDFDGDFFRVVKHVGTIN